MWGLVVVLTIVIAIVIVMEVIVGIITIIIIITIDIINIMVIIITYYYHGLPRWLAVTRCYLQLVLETCSPTKNDEPSLTSCVLEAEHGEHGSTSWVVGQ